MKRTSIFLALLSLSGLSHAFSGQVIDDNGNPVAKARVEIIGTRKDITTDTNGHFVVKIVTDAVDEIHIEAKGYGHRILHLHGQQAAPLTITLQRSVIEQIDVIGLPLHASTIESALPITVISGDELRNKQASTLGETLKNEVGVHSSYFGPVASSPIIRGLDGPRVLITQNGLDVSDASRVGPDHVVATEASTAEQIEILRGPATLFYGSGAIGGVVNIVDDRVPRSSEAKGDFSVAHNTVANEDEVSLAYTGGNDSIAVHIDGFWRDGSNYKIPGIAELETDEEHEAEGHNDHRKGVLENSAAKSEGFNVGASWLLDNGFIGLSYGRLDRLNGVPGHAHEEDEGAHEEEHEEEEVVLSDLSQDRWQLISELSLDNEYLSGLNTRIGYTDYEHIEFESGETGTVFRNETLQAKMDFLHQEFSGWRGALSIEGKTTDFEAVGDEAFTPPSTTDTFALALVEEKHTGNILWQLGARIEKVSLKADAIEWEEGHHDDAEEEEHGHALLHFDDLDYTPFSVSAGLVWDFSPGYNIGVALTHSQRAPTASELFSAGPHIGTGSYEVGALFTLHEEEDGAHLDYTGKADKEVSNNIDLSLRKHEGDVGFVINVFYNQVSDFYYQRNTGYTSEALFDHEEEAEAHNHGGDLPVYIFEQTDATFYGLEAEVVWQFATPFKLTVWGDSIRAKLDDGGNLPRIPPFRLGSQLNYRHSGWNGQVGVTHYFEQDDIDAFETNTDSYTLMDAQLAYTFFGSSGDLTIFAKGTNLTDEEARVHSSFLKDRAPLPGRGFSVGIRSMF
ncbi:MAG: TonB-dependent receptor [Gammaproteobacteria bacterium]|nr:TonB-dependent receptor [Gammaproteobacteria bacterium]MBQ0839378.1 TonB-dependent receptor [Gammaproteobacteria bacterium]